MAYIVVVNPAILATPGTGMPFSGALTATVLIASSMTLLMGLYARLPFAVAPGMGLNAFFAFTIVMQDKVPWQTALGMVFWAGVLFLVVSATPAARAHRAGDPRAASVRSRRRASGCCSRSSACETPGSSSAIRRRSCAWARSTTVRRSCCSGILVAVALMRRSNPLAFLAAIFSVTALAWTLGYATAAGPAGQRARLFLGVPGARHPRARSGSRCCRRFSRFSSRTCSIRCRRSSASRARPA